MRRVPFRAPVPVGSPPAPLPTLPSPAGAGIAPGRQTGMGVGTTLAAGITPIPPGYCAMIMFLSGAAASITPVYTNKKSANSYSIINPGDAYYFRNPGDGTGMVGLSASAADSNTAVELISDGPYPFFRAGFVASFPVLVTSGKVLGKTVTTIVFNFTSPPAGTYMVVGMLNITAYVSGAVTVGLIYQDENAQLRNLPMGFLVAASTSLTASLGALPAHGLTMIPYHFDIDASGTHVEITVTLSGGNNSATFDATFELYRMQ